VSCTANIRRAQTVLQNGQQVFLDGSAALRGVLNAVRDAKQQIAETDLSTSLKSQQRDCQCESSTGTLQVLVYKLIVAG
jgi:hypothetical protein